LNETLFLAPLPVYTGQVPVSRRHFSAMNETYLELGSNHGIVEQGKRLAVFILMILFMALAPCLVVLYWVLFIQKTFVSR
jgi:hypothetical protein